MGDVTGRGQQAMGGMVADAIMRRNVEEFLPAGEELLAASFVRDKGKGVWSWGRRGQKGPDGVEFEAAMVLAITRRRLMLFRIGSKLKKELKGVLADLPIADIESLEVRKGALVQHVTFTVHDRPYGVEVVTGSATSLKDAFDQARSPA